MALSDLPPSGPPGDRFQFEVLLTDISAQLIAVPSDGLAGAVRSALDAVRRFFGADRCALLAVSDTLATVHVAHAALAPGVSGISGDVDLASRFPWVSRRLLVDHQPVVLPSVSSLPPEAAVDLASFASLSTLSSLIIPIVAGPARIHLILVSTVAEERAWPDEYVPRLRLLGEMLVHALERGRALDDVQRLRERLEHENVVLRQEVRRRLGSEDVAGRSPAIRRALSLAEQVAPTNSTVLLVGETGCGKERFATYIHASSRRRDRPMVRVNCSAIPTPLMESELFGREKGAYTGALSKQVGRFELAHGSTLFLDEIGELPVEVQVKLLRALEERTIERLGNPRPIAIDVRIIAATHRDLAAAVHSGRFREDLYYRLKVFPIEVPPLRERREDIPLLVRAFVDELSEAMGKQIETIDEASMEALVAYPWPGNVRELRNVVERAIILSRDAVLRIDLPESESRQAVPAPDLAAVERDHILRVLQDTGWRIRGVHGAAARLGLKPTTLESRIRRLGISRPGN